MGTVKINNPLSAKSFFARQAANDLRTTIDVAKSDGFLSEAEKNKIAQKHLVASIALKNAN